MTLKDKLKHIGIVGVTLASLVSSASLGGCADNSNKPYLIADRENNNVSLLAHDKDGIRYFRIVSEDGKVVFDTRKCEKFRGLGLEGNPISEGIQDYRDIKLDPNRTYFLEIVDTRGNITKVKEKRN